MEKDYKNSVIYRIYCKNPDITECYIGSTKCFEDRFYSHKSTCNIKHNIKHNKRHNLYLYQFIRDNGGWNNFDREILEYYDCNNEEEIKLILLRISSPIILAKKNIKINLYLKT